MAACRRKVSTTVRSRAASGFRATPYRNSPSVIEEMATLAMGIFARRLSTAGSFPFRRQLTVLVSSKYGLGITGRVLAAACQTVPTRKHPARRSLWKQYVEQCVLRAGATADQ